MAEYRIEQLRAEETYPLRQKELREGKSFDKCMMPGDELETSIHMGLKLEGKICSIASFQLCHSLIDNTCIEPVNIKNMGKELLEQNKNKEIYRLRGMATDREYFGKGYGRLLLDFGCEHLKQLGGELLWCDAREAVRGFYLKQSFQIIGDIYMVPGVGPHYKMWKYL